MLHKYAVKVVDLLYLRSALLDKNRNIYIYGAELSLSTLGTSSFILLLSFLFGQILNGVVFLGIFISLRLFAGGYHAETYCNCFFLTNGVFLISLGVSQLLAKHAEPFFLLIVLGVSLILICVLTPIRNPHHPLTESLYFKNKQISRVLAGTECCVCAVIYNATRNMKFLSIATVSVAAVAVMMIIPKVQNRKEVQMNE